MSSTPTEALGSPRLTIYNTSTSWLALKNYDLVIYEHGVLIVLGLTMGNVGREKRRRREVRKAGARGLLVHVPAANAERSAKIAATPVQTILAADSGNRLVPLAEIESVVLSRGPISCKLKLRLTDGTRLKFIWLNWASRGYADYDDVAKTLTDLLPERFRAS
jgi:hypothetical protein